MVNRGSTMNMIKQGFENEHDKISVITEQDKSKPPQTMNMIKQRHRGI